MKDLIVRLKIHEGLRLEPYQDVFGNWAIGYGHTCHRDHPVINPEQADAYLLDDVHKASQAVMSLPLSAKLCQVRRGVLVELCFWVGFNGLLKFRKMLTALRQGNPKRAALELYHSQLGTKFSRRAYDLAVLMWEGESA
jgi:lysozyme